MQRSPSRVALIHYWLIGMRGGERVLEELCRMFPDADIYTHVLDRRRLSSNFEGRSIYTTYIGHLPLSRKLYKAYLPLMPGAIESLDLSGYDLVISSESGPAKGVITNPGAKHVCYCHSPMRYLWDQHALYRREAKFPEKLAMDLFSSSLRTWDVTSAARVDRFVANSTHVSRRIEKYWRRSSDIVYPPVNTDLFSPVDADEIGDFYLWAGELVGYKRPDIAINAFNKLGKRLIVIGGPEKEVKRLRARAKENITFLGKVSFQTLKYYMARARALVFPGEEDFGIVPVEVMASGRPVIAYASGGALDTVVDGKTGILFDCQDEDCLIEAIERFERDMLRFVSADVNVSNAKKFNVRQFRHGIERVIEEMG